ncbi:MAG TPA: hypothetical protein VM677_11615 [Actinokineospora sp.]|nr:hypothetical protein [Actinokineospora sp.]
MKPRPLSDNERAALAAMLSIDFPGAVELRIQAESVVVVGRCGCGCPTIDLAVAEAAPLAVVDSGTPVWADVQGVDDGMILMVADGRLSCLEIYTVDGSTPAEFPAPGVIEPQLDHSHWADPDA